MEDKKRRCPYCGEEILETAIKCKHCQPWIKKKCPFCAEMIDSNLDRCPFCDSNLKEVNEEPKERVQISKEPIKGNKNKEQEKDTGLVDWSSVNFFFKHPILSIIIIAIAVHIFGNPFSDLWRTVKEDDETYCMKTKVLDGEKRTFCSKDEKDLISFKNCLNSPQVKFMQIADKGFFGDYSQATDDSFYPVCKPVSVWEKTKQHNVDESADNSANDTGASCQLGDLIGEDVEVVKYNGIYEHDIQYHTSDFSPEDIKKMAKQCEAEGGVYGEDFDCCISQKMYPLNDEE